MISIRSARCALVSFLLGSTAFLFAQATSDSNSESLINAAALSQPLFVAQSLYPSGRAVVFGVAKADSEDVVLLDNGFDQGFRTGMRCEVIRGEETVGEIVLVEVRSDRAAGLITALESKKNIQFNDIVRIKTVQFTNQN